MQIMLLPLLTLAAVISCGPKSLPMQEEARSVDVPVRSRILSGADLTVWPTVDTTDRATVDAIATLSRFFDQKHHAQDAHDFWFAGDLERYEQPYKDLLYVEYDSVGGLRYLPTLTRSVPVNDGDRILTVKWAAIDGSGIAADVRYVFDFHARRTDEGMRLSLPVEHNTSAWQRVDEGPLHYVISPLHRFSSEQARNQNDTVQRLAQFFGIEPFPITYYSCADPVDLFRTRGFQMHPLLFDHPTGGMVDPGRQVWSGNDKDIYTHEIVHLFTEKKFGPRPDLLEEGLATLLGGSSEQPYAWHRENLRQLLVDMDIDVRGRCNPYVQDFINEHTHVPYVIGAVLCESVLRRSGKEGLFKAMGSGTDAWTALAPYGITPDTLGVVLRAELDRPVLPVL